eukprot:7460608-Alexandrium_andersonii.AAC.1
MSTCDHRQPGFHPAVSGRPRMDIRGLRGGLNPPWRASSATPLLRKQRSGGTPYSVCARTLLHKA